jgi:DNA processing protein
MPASHPADDPVRRARAYLLAVAEPPAPALTALIAARSPVEAAARVRAGQVPGAVLDETAARRAHERVDEHFAAAERVGARLVIPEDAEWPTHLAVLSPALALGARWAAPPVALWVRGPGRLADRLERAVAVVGARAATAYGEHVATDFGYQLTAEQVTVVTGGGYGIEVAALRGALAAEGGAPVVVLGSGIDVVYPSGNERYFTEVAERGVLVSEYPPGAPPARHRMVHRGRLLAAGTAGTVLVEAGLRSGARTVITMAATLGRAVMAVPGPITSSMSIGCHELIRTGTALPVASVTEIVESAAAVYPGLRPEPQTSSTD